MTITLIQSRGTHFDFAESGSLAYNTNVSAGSRLVVAVVKYAPSADAPVLADISKSAGTATLGTWTLDRVDTRLYSGAEYEYSAIYSAPVTGAGSCTIQIAGGVGGNWWDLVIMELGGNAIVVEGANGANGASGAPDSGNVASAGAAIFVGCLATYATGTLAHTQDSAFTLVYEQEDVAYQTGAAIYRISTGALTDSASWTAPTTLAWVASLVVYSETASGVTVTPAAATVKGAVVAPTVILGALTITPAIVTVKGAVVAPTVILGAITITPSPATAKGATVNPTVIVGSAITPSPVTVRAVVVAPTVILGAITITPSPATAKGATVNPTVIVGSAITPAAVTVRAVTINPTVILGALTITPAAVTVRAVRVNPTVYVTGLPVPPLGQDDTPGLIIYLLAHAIYAELTAAGLGAGLQEPNKANAATWADYLFS